MHSTEDYNDISMLIPNCRMYLWFREGVKKDRLSLWWGGALTNHERVFGMYIFLGYLFMREILYSEICFFLLILD